MYRTVVLLLVGLVLLTAGSPRLFSLAAAPQAIAQRRAPAAVVLRSSGRGAGVPGQQGASSAWPAALPDWGTGVPGASSAQGTRARPWLGAALFAAAAAAGFSAAGPAAPSGQLRRPAAATLPKYAALGLFDLFGSSDKDTLIPREQALPGRPTEMLVKSRHYVLGTRMKAPWPEGSKVCVFANGCFWGSEKGIWRLPGEGIISTAVGYAAGFTPNPTYEEACSGRTGSTEAVQVVFDPLKISIVDILRWFWEAHDPTQGMGQGNDRGTQYRSGLYYFDDEQKALFEASARAYEEALMAARRGRGPITTEIAAAADYDEVFYYAESYHQQYLAQPMARPYCSAQPQEVSLPPFETWAPPGLEHHAPKLPEAFWKKHGPKAGCVIRSPNDPIKWP